MEIIAVDKTPQFNNTWSARKEDPDIVSVTISLTTSERIETGLYADQLIISRCDHGDMFYDIYHFAHSSGDIVGLCDGKIYDSIDYMCPDCRFNTCNSRIKTPLSCSNPGTL